MRRILFQISILLFITVNYVNGQQIEYIGSTLWSDARCVKVVGNYAYCTFANGLGILDIVDIAHPTMIGQIKLREANAIVINGEYAYVTSCGPGLYVIDIQYPARPVQVGFCGTGGCTQDVAISGNYAFVVNDNGLLQTIDISNPRNPLIADSFSIGSHSRIFLAGDYAYVAGGENSLKIINVSNPINPINVSDFPTPSPSVDVFVVNEFAYMLTGSYLDQNTLTVVNISDPGNPVSVSSLNLLPIVRSIEVSGHYAFICNAWRGLQIADIGNPLAPVLLTGYLWTDGGARDITISDSNCFITDELYGIRIIGIGDPLNPILLGGYYIPGLVSDIAVDSDYAYVMRESNGVDVVDISNPMNPIRVGSIDLDPDCLHLICASQGYVYSAWRSLKVIDTVDPTAPSIIFTEPLSGCASGMQVQGGYLYIAQNNIGGFEDLVIYNIADPSNLSHVGTLNTIDRTAGIFVRGNYAYVTYTDIEGTSPGLQIINIADPSNPISVGSVQLEYPAAELYVEGNYAYLARGLDIVDVSDPSNPIIVANHTTTDHMVHDIFVDENLVFLPEDFYGLELWNVSDPSNIVLIDRYESIEALSVIERNDYVYLADGHSLTILRVVGACSGIAGDSNNDGAFNGLDVIFSVNYFKGIGIAPSCRINCSQYEGLFEGGDANGNCVYNGIDVTYSVAYLKGIGPAPSICPDCTK